jgi:hypothetical protein
MRIFVLAQADFGLRTNHSNLIQKSKVTAALEARANRFVRLD